jgi:hypothetical protein
LDAEAGVKLRSPKGCAAAHGLDACIRVQHPFMPAGDTSHPNQINPIKNPLDSEHGIYRECRHDEAIHALRRPASEKRQGTKSREAGTGGAAGVYGDLAAVR